MMLSKLVDRFRRRPTLRARSRIEYDRVPRPEWQAMLDAQHIPGTARLAVAWEAGDVWQPIHRWMLWQMQPWAYVDPAIKAELQGPHPRSRGHYCAPGSCDCKDELNRPKHLYRWKGGACKLIDRRVWELHRWWATQTGELVRPRRLWVVQGDAGGHPFQIGPEEQALRSAQGLPADVPSAGDLPYAEPDSRVLYALERYDLWRWAHQVGSDPITKVANVHIDRLRGAELEANRLRWAEWDDFAAEMADGMAHAARKDGLHRLRMTPVGSKGRAVDHDRIAHQFLTTTTLEAVA